MWILVVQSGVKKENIYEQINLALSTKQHGRPAEHMVAALEKAYGKSGHRTPKKVITQIDMLLFIHTVCLHLEQAFETVLKEVKLDIDVLEETVAL